MDPKWIQNGLTFLRKKVIQFRRQTCIQHDAEWTLLNPFFAQKMHPFWIQNGSKMDSLSGSILAPWLGTMVRAEASEKTTKKYSAIRMAHSEFKKFALEFCKFLKKRTLQSKMGSTVYWGSAPDPAGGPPRTPVYCFLPCHDHWLPLAPHRFR